MCPVPRVKRLGSRVCKGLCSTPSALNIHGSWSLLPLTRTNLRPPHKPHSQSPWGPFTPHKDRSYAPHVRSFCHEPRTQSP